MASKFSNKGTDSVLVCCVVTKTEQDPSFLSQLSNVHIVPMHSFPLLVLLMLNLASAAAKILHLRWLLAAPDASACLYILQIVFTPEMAVSQVMGLVAYFAPCQSVFRTLMEALATDAIPFAECPHFFTWRFHCRVISY
jgi:hypothetical protein